MKLHDCQFQRASHQSTCNALTVAPRTFYRLRDSIVYVYHCAPLWAAFWEIGQRQWDEEVWVWPYGCDTPQPPRMPWTIRELLR